jgi:hypothetical protein
MTCTVQLLYEVHDPAAYVTPDAIVDFTKIRFDQIGRNRVRMTGPGYRGKPPTLKVSGFVARPGIIADIEIGFAGTGAYERTRRAVETLRLRLSDWSDADIRIDVVGVNSILGEASVPTNALPSEARLHVSAICIDEAQALIVEDEVYALTTVRACGWRGRAQRAACAHRYIDRFHSARAREASCSLECRMRVHTLAAGRAGDKGDALDLTLVARDADAYALLERTLSAEAVRVALNRVAPGSVVRYEVPGLLALKFVAPHALPGGVYASLHAGLHWQKAAIWVLLEMDIEA